MSGSGTRGWPELICNMINLGDKVKDSVTGFIGIAVGRTIWIHGCDRITVQPEGITKEGKLFESLSFDEPALVTLKKKVKKEGKHDTGGPRMEPHAKVNIKK